MKDSVDSTGEEHIVRFVWDATATPLGTGIGVFSTTGLVSFRLTPDPVEHALAQLAAVVPGSLEHQPGALASLAGELDEYFGGTRTSFSQPLDWQLAAGFTRDALQAVCQIAYGEVASYGEVAILAGKPRAARAVGTACKNSPFSVIVPVHRVVRADGTMGEYGAHSDIKRALLELEGADVKF